MINLRPKHQTSIVTVMLPLLVIWSGCRSAQTGPSSAAVTCDQPCESGSPKIVFVDTEYDFGTISAGAEKSCTFDFINDGGKDLMIERIHASCGCTSTTTENMVIESGQASEISVKYHADSYGKVKKQIVVYTNDPEHHQVSLWITAEIKGPPARHEHISSNASSKPEEKQPPKDTMPKQLKQALRDLNKATGG